MKRFMMITSSLALLLFLSVLFASSATFNVLKFGAKGNGIADDTRAFLATWEAACKNPNNPAIMIPIQSKFLLGDITFQGPCRSNIYFQVNGNISRSTKSREIQYWIGFKALNGLAITGPGQIDGRGLQYWPCVRHHKCPRAPTMVKIMESQNVQVRGGLKLTNSPETHINVYNSNQVTVDNLTITSPSNTPNTDGVHVQRSHHVWLQNIHISTGDDCISIGTGTFNLNISAITCTSGHGISIGSLGKKGTEAEVNQIFVQNSHLTRTTNGLRIKTWQGGSGYATGISFIHVNLTEVKHPIVIDQYYCPHKHCLDQTSAVKVSNVKYVGIKGTSSSPAGIELKCSKSIGCVNITMEDVNIRRANGNKVDAFCINARGFKRGSVYPSVPCLT